MISPPLPGGVETAAAKREQLLDLLSERMYPDAGTLEALDRAYIAERLSPGGSADLLALCWLLHFLREM